MMKVLQMMKVKTPDGFKEKHPAHRGIPGGNQVDGFVGEISTESIPVLEMQVSLYPELVSVCHCLMQSVTLFVASSGLLLAIIGNACSAYPWTIMSILLGLNFIAALAS